MSERTDVRPSGEHTLHRMRIWVDVIPLRESTTVFHIGREVAENLRYLRHAERIVRGGVRDDRYDILDRGHAFRIHPTWCEALVTVGEVAAMLDCSPSTVRRMIRTGTFEPFSDPARPERATMIPLWQVRRHVGGDDS